jgi:phage N-6-adenine-methyltransferase
LRIGLVSSFYTGPALSSVTDKWATPPDLFAALDRIFHFKIDVCASSDNAKCERYFTEADDGLSQEWTGACWMNPPYGRDIIKWMRKAWESSERGATVVCLVPARTDTKWWQHYATLGHFAFLRSRLRFGDAKASASFPSAIVVFSKTFDAEILQCIVCNGVFAARRSHAKVCGNRCQVRLHRERRAAA